MHVCMPTLLWSITMWSLEMYSNYFEWNPCSFLLRYVYVQYCLILHHYTINNDYTWYNICSTKLFRYQNQNINLFFHILDQQIYYTVNQTLNDAFEVGSTCTNSQLSQQQILLHIVICICTYIHRYHASLVLYYLQQAYIDVVGSYYFQVFCYLQRLLGDIERAENDTNFELDRRPMIYVSRQFVMCYFS